MRDYRYSAQLAEDPDGGLIVTFRDVPEAITFGQDRQEALRSAAEALGLALRGYLAAGRPLPEAVAAGEDLVSPHADDLLKLAVVETFRRTGMTIEDFRQVSGLNEWQVVGLLAPDAPSEVADLEHALGALGQRLHIAVEAA